MKPMTINQPYKPTGTAGHTIEDWLEMTPLQQAEAHLIVMQKTAQKWAWVQWRESLGVPVTVPADAQTLLELCDNALEAIRDGDESAILLAMQATAQAAELNRWTAIDKALSLQQKASKPRSTGGKTTAAQRKEEALARREKVARAYLELESKDKRERTGILAKRFGIDPKTVRTYLKEAGLR